jgi:hypothetical protein
VSLAKEELHDERTTNGCVLRAVGGSLPRKATDPVLRTQLLMVWCLSLGDSLASESIEPRLSLTAKGSMSTALLL